jgi:hypothetical protein
MEVFENSEIFEYLQKRNLIKQYQKAKKKLENDQLMAVHFKKRKPKSEDLFQFRISHKYRGWGIFKDGYFQVIHIDDHQ